MSVIRPNLNALSGLLAAILLAGAAALPVVASTAGEIQLASVHATVGNLETGEMLYAKREEIPVPIASVTKLMTALVVLDAGQNLDEWVEIVPFDRSFGKNRYSRLRVGAESTRGQLIRLALMASDNLAAWVLARQYPGGVDRFAAAMNAKARDLGMSGSHFDDPTGLSTANRSTAADLWKLVRAAYGNVTIREYSITPRYTATFRNPRHTIAYGNTNPLTASSRWEIELSKTGYLDEAGRCLVLVANVDGDPIGIVLLNSFGTRTPQGDAARVRRWLESGSRGRIAGAARDYERRVSAEIDRSSPSDEPEAR